MGQYNWTEFKKDFMTGDYKSLREFAKKHELPYNSNFRRMTKGWVSERDAKLVQMCSKYTEKSLGDKTEKFVVLKEVIDETGADLFYLLNDFIQNKDFSKFPLKQKIDGESIIEVVEVPYIKINEINKAVNALNKINKVLKKAYPSLVKATGC
jgi:hypothetical protein